MNKFKITAKTIRAKEIFERALILPPKKQLEFISSQCIDDVELLHECNSLFENMRNDESFLEHLYEVFPSETEQCLIGETFGIYRLNKKLGSGGMADVYSATRTDGVHDKAVALKLIRGWGDTEELISRFNLERKILAALKHPNIALFLDGGISKLNRPYYVMELIEGEHIDIYCRQHSLSTTEKIKLFIKVCSAVSSAHRQLIIHRDLKPGNILVTAQGEVKLLDFGIAKLLESDKADNKLSVLGTPMTPRYSSPEQIQRQPLTTASDQYSLGVLLYELLVDSCPYDFIENSNYIAAVCSEEPPAPSEAVIAETSDRKSKKLSRELSGDLDTIIMKAMQKDPLRRYSSVQQFSEDLLHYQEKRPILARKDSSFYLLTRFIQRNLAITALSLLMTLALLLVGLVQQVRVIAERDLAHMERENAQRERDIAQKNFKMAQQKTELATQVQDFLVGLFKISDPGEARGNSISAREILDRGVIKIEQELKTQPETKSALLNTMGVVYRELGLYETATPLLNRALSLRQLSTSSSSIDIAESLTNLAVLLRNKAEYKEAEKLLLNARDILANINSGESKHIADTYNELGNVSWYQGKLDETYQYYQKALNIRIKVLGEKHLKVSISYNNMGVYSSHTREFDKAIEYYNKSLSIIDETLGSEHPEVAFAYNNIGNVHWRRANYPEAIRFYEKALAIKIKAVGKEHPMVASIYNNLAVAISDLGDHDKAIFYYEKALSIFFNSLGENHADVAESYNNLGFEYTKIGQYQKALEYFEKDIAIKIESLGEVHPRVAKTYLNMAALFEKIEKDSKTIEYTNKSLSILKLSVDEDHPLYAFAYLNLGKIYSKKMDYQQAQDLFQRALSISLKSFDDKHPDTVEIQEELDKLQTTRKK